MPSDTTHIEVMLQCLSCKTEFDCIIILGERNIFACPHGCTSELIFLGIDVDENKPAELPT